MDLIVVNEKCARSEIAEALEARTRRLMAERAALACTWQTRGRRAELRQEIEDSLDEYLAMS